MVERSGAILTLAEYDKNPVKEGQKIKAKVSFRGDERFGGYFLSDIQTLKETSRQNGKEAEPSRYCAFIIIILLAIIFCVVSKKIRALNYRYRKFGKHFRS